MTHIVIKSLCNAFVLCCGSLGCSIHNENFQRDYNQNQLNSVGTVSSHQVCGIHLQQSGQLLPK